MYIQSGDSVIQGEATMKYEARSWEITQYNKGNKQAYCMPERKTMSMTEKGEENVFLTETDGKYLDASFFSVMKRALFKRN